MILFHSPKIRVIDPYPGTPFLQDEKPSAVKNKRNALAY
jgi:hypothetical protein